MLGWLGGWFSQSDKMWSEILSSAIAEMSDMAECGKRTYYLFLLQNIIKQNLPPRLKKLISLPPPFKKNIVLYCWSSIKVVIIICISVKQRRKFLRGKRKYERKSQSKSQSNFRGNHEYVLFLRNPPFLMNYENVKAGISLCILYLFCIDVFMFILRRAGNIKY